MSNRNTLVIVCTIIAIISAVLLVAAFQPRPRNIIRLLPNKYGSVVRLVLDGATFCTGTVIGPHTILTARHCVVQETPYMPPINREGIEIRPSNNADLNITAKVMSIRHQFDQAILEGDFNKFMTRPFISDVTELTILRKTSKLRACGYPLGGPFFCTPVKYKHPDNFMWAAEGVLIPGMSGGCLLDEEGNIVATNVAVMGRYSIFSPTYNLHMERVH